MKMILSTDYLRGVREIDPLRSRSCGRRITEDCWDGEAHNEEE